MNNAFRFGLKTIFVYTTLIAGFIFLNLRVETIDEACNDVKPCVNIGYDDVPKGYEDRIPGPLKAGEQYRLPLKNEMWATSATLKRGWPLEIENSTGFLYRLDDSRKWFGVTGAGTAGTSEHISPMAFSINILLFLIAMVTIQLLMQFLLRKFQSIQQNASLPI